MNITITGQHIDVGDSLRAHVMGVLAEVTQGMFQNPIDGRVTFSKQRHQFLVEISLHPQAGIMIQGHSAADEAYPAFDLAVDKIRRQLKRYKTKLKDHRHQKVNEVIQTLSAQQYVLENNPFCEEPVLADAQPIIIAEIETPIDSLSVGEAVMHMDLRDSSTLVFRNKKHGGLNVIYRRPDGNIGWIDPQNNVKV